MKEETVFSKIFNCVKEQFNNKIHPGHYFLVEATQKEVDDMNNFFGREFTVTYLSTMYNLPKDCTNMFLMSQTLFVIKPSDIFKVSIGGKKTDIKKP